MRQLPLSVRVRDSALFANYLAGPNEPVLAQLRALAAHAGCGWLCGPAGSGKSHLLQALCAESAAIAYLPLSQLTPFGPAALQEWQGTAGLCLDELATVVGHLEWERALFALYRDCEERGATLLFAARAAPAELPFALADLASRCAAAQRLTLQALDETQQGAALHLRAHQRGLELPEDATRYLQRRLPRAMSHLCTALDELDEAALVGQRRLTVPFVRELLERRAPGLARRYAVTGNVQGVWYRASAARQAEALEVSGYARNCQDGSVEVLACGSAAALREFVGWLWVGPPDARVSAVTEIAAPATLPWPPDFTTA